MHGLLACDRAAFAPRFWQLQRPAPPPSSAFDSGVRYARAALTVSAARAMLPKLRDVHPLATRQPEECVFLFRDVGVYAVAFPAFGYLRWLRGEGAGAVDYGRYRRHLQVLLASQSGRRPVLKSPFHLGHLDDLLAALPDALVVHTRRDPTSALASWCSLAATIGRGTVASLDLRTLGQSWLDFWAHAAERAVAVRGLADTRRIHDVRYADLVADPLREVRRLYVAADLELTPSAAAANGTMARSAPPAPAPTAPLQPRGVRSRPNDGRGAISAPTEHCDAVTTSPSVPTLHSPRCHFR